MVSRDSVTNSDPRILSSRIEYRSASSDVPFDISPQSKYDTHSDIGNMQFPDMWLPPRRIRNAFSPAIGYQSPETDYQSYCAVSSDLIDRQMHSPPDQLSFSQVPLYYSSDPPTCYSASPSANDPPAETLSSYDCIFEFQEFASLFPQCDTINFSQDDLYDLSFAQLDPLHSCILPEHNHGQESRELTSRPSPLNLEWQVEGLDTFQ